MAIFSQSFFQIIAGAYTRAGFDEAILTPRSGGNGRDVVATKRGIRSIHFFYRVKAYKQGHLVTAGGRHMLIRI